MTSIWIIGAGKFGCKAAQKLKAKHPGACLTVVDKDENKCRLNQFPGIDVVCMDGIAFLSAGLAGSTHPDQPEWIIPAVPIHVAWHWIRVQLEKEFEVMPVEIPDEIVCLLPNPIKGKGTEVYASLADFFCPDDCPEPVKTCTVTRKPRPCNLYERIQRIDVPGFTSIVIQSRQLAPGVGGYRPRVLFEALSAIYMTQTAVVLSTSCRCHAVLQAFRLIKRDF
jgi:hypothetical protein